MSDLKQGVRYILWQGLKKHYNVDQKEPRMLLYKEILMSGNPIDEIADQLAIIIEEMLAAQAKPDPEKLEDKEAFNWEDLAYGPYSTSSD